jgi:hypothetical protein
MKENIFYFIYYCFYSLLHIASMMLIMTMNGTVLTSLFIGYSAAFIIYGFDCDRDKTLPVNCCAWGKIDKISLIKMKMKIK